jgi:hypothetical protein
MTDEERDTQRKFKVLRHTERIGDAGKHADTSALADQDSTAGKPHSSRTAKPR